MGGGAAGLRERPALGAPTEGLMTTPTQPSRGRSRGYRATPDGAGGRIRWAKVRAARRRVASGYYDRPAVREAVAQALWREFSRR